MKVWPDEQADPQLYILATSFFSDRGPVSNVAEGHGCS